MKLLADLHTHSKNSRFFHGKNSIEEMAIEANEIGLEEIAITDHGFKHLFKTNKEKIKEARKVIDEINKWSKTKVLLGVEADIISEDGTLDIDNETISYLDILLVGYHKMIKTDFAGFFGGQEKSQEAIQRCTNAYINAINKYPVTILTHLDSILTTDLYQIGVACRDKEVMVEINNRHTNWTEKQMDDLLASGCLFVVSSDAHSREAVGEVKNAFDLIKKYKIPNDLLVNVEFDEDEKTEDDKDVDLYYSIYKQKKLEHEEKIKNLEEKRKTEFTETLSTEMEDALAKIAKEKGIAYEKKSSIDDEMEDFTLDSVLNLTSEEDEELIRKANEIIDNKSFSEFDAQNEKLDEMKEIEEEKVANEEAKEPQTLEETKTEPAEVVSLDEKNQESKQNGNSVNRKNGFSLNITALENGDEKKQNQENKIEPASQKTTKNDISGFVKYALDENPKEMEKQQKTEQKSEMSARKEKSKFNPLGILDIDKINDDNKK